MASVRLDDPLAHTLAEIVGPDHTVVDPELRAAFERDWTGAFGAPARVVVRPRDEDQVAAVLAACAEAEAAVVPQGGNTGLVGGGVPRGGEVVLSTTRLTECGPVDLAAQRVVVGAGTTLAAAQRLAAESGLEFPLDFGARDSATVGGMVSTNAGGVRVMRRGTMGERVDALRMATADGRLVGRLDGPSKDTAGYPVTRLAVGSEGTLGVITAARLRLAAPAPHRAVALFALAGVEHAVELLAVLRRDLGSLESADFFLDDGLRLALAHLGRRRPVGVAPAYLLAECAGDADPLPAFAAALEGAAEPTDIAVADDSAGRRSLWELRERIPMALGERGFVSKYDVAVAVGDVPALIAGVRRALTGVGVDGDALCAFGHLAEGNVHLNVAAGSPAEVPPDQAERVLMVVAELGGTVSAEHGIGIAKRRWLGLTRSASEIRLMEAVKRCLDPAGLLNPGVVLPAWGERPEVSRP